MRVLRYFGYIYKSEKKEGKEEMIKEEKKGMERGSVSACLLIINGRGSKYSRWQSVYSAPTYFSDIYMYSFNSTSL